MGRASRFLLLAALLVASAPAGAGAASPLKVREVFPGSAAAGPNAEYVQLQMSADGQSVISGQALRFYDSDGDLSASFTVPADVANGQSQRSVLFASEEAAAEIGALPEPDFSLGGDSDRIDPGGGAVCFTGSGTGLAFDDCVTWGSIPLFGLGDPFPEAQLANAAAIPDAAALRRSIARGCPTYLDAPDESGDSAADFAAAAPAPRNNAAVPVEVRCPPDTALITFPLSPTSQRSAEFTYVADPAEPGASFECKLDAEPFAPCPSGGRSYPGPLAEGFHTFVVKATGEGGTDPTPRSFSWIVDAQPPQTTIESRPPEPSGGFEARFTYSSSEPASSFRCQLDGGPVQLCPGSGKSFYQLADGGHVFRVWAVDNAGNQDPVGAQSSFTVLGDLIDLTPPDTSIVSAPPPRSSADSASFAYASTEQGSSFECSLAGAPFAACPASGIGYANLRNGIYQFAVRARDRVGNLDSVPATYAWEVAAPLPTVRFTKAPPGNVRIRKGSKATLRFRFKADKPGSTFRCRIDRRAFKPCRASTKVRAGIGRHRFEVYAIDRLGNVGTSVAKRIIRVQKRRGGGFF